MRGKAGHQVSIYVSHKGIEPKRLTDEGAGHLRDGHLQAARQPASATCLSGFSGTTTRDMMAAIRR